MKSALSLSLLCLASVVAGLGCGGDADDPEQVAEATAAVLSPDVTSLNFGTLHVNTSSTLDVTLTNSGTQNTDITSASTTSTPFTPGLFCPCLRPGQSCPLPVTFHPASTGNFSDTLTIKTVTGGHQDPDITVALSGSAVP